MIDIEQREKEETEYDSRFVVDASSPDNGAFFNLRNDFSTPRQETTGYQTQHDFTGAFSGFPQRTGFHNNDQITFSAPPQQSTGQKSCNGNCGSCIWSFLCSSARGAGIGVGAIPRLG